MATQNEVKDDNNPASAQYEIIRQKVESIASIHKQERMIAEARYDYDKASKLSATIKEWQAAAVAEVKGYTPDSVKKVYETLNVKAKEVFALSDTRTFADITAEWNDAIESTKKNIDGVDEKILPSAKKDELKKQLVDKQQSLFDDQIKAMKQSLESQETTAKLRYQGIKAAKELGYRPNHNQKYLIPIRFGDLEPEPKVKKQMRGKALLVATVNGDEDEFYERLSRLQENKEGNYQVIKIENGERIETNNYIELRNGTVRPRFPLTGNGKEAYECAINLLAMKGANGFVIKYDEGFLGGSALKSTTQLKRLADIMEYALSKNITPQFAPEVWGKLLDIKRSFDSSASPFNHFAKQELQRIFALHKHLQEQIELSKQVGNTPDEMRENATKLTQQLNKNEHSRQEFKKEIEGKAPADAVKAVIKDYNTANPKDQVAGLLAEAQQVSSRLKEVHKANNVLSSQLTQVEKNNYSFSEHVGSFTELQKARESELQDLKGRHEGLAAVAKDFDKAFEKGLDKEGKDNLSSLRRCLFDMPHTIAGIEANAATVDSKLQAAQHAAPQNPPTPGT